MESTDPAAEALAELGRGREDTLCRAPFTQLHFDPTGHVSVCSKSTHRRLGHVATADLRELWLGPGIAAIRAALAQRRFPDGCEFCAWNLQQGNVADHPARTFDARPLPADLAWPAHLEFAFSNVCNLACIQCSPELSSTIRARRGMPPLRSPYGDGFFAQIEPFLAHAAGVSLLGGEPFLQRECFRLLDLLIQSGRRIPVHVTTNGTRFDATVERVLTHLPVDLAVSLDGVRPETIERIRVGARASVLLKNLKRFAKHTRRSGRKLTLNFCLMRENWRELPDLFLLAQKLGAGVWVMPVTHPSVNSLFTLPKETWGEVARVWRAREAKVLRRASDEQKRTWSSLVAMLGSSQGAAGERGVWKPPERIESALARIASDDLAGALVELDEVLPQRPESTQAMLLRGWLHSEAGHDARDPVNAAAQTSAEAAGAQAVLLLPRMITLERAGATGRAQYAAAAAALADLASAFPKEVATTFPGGPMATAWRLAASHLPETALHVACCTASADPQRLRSLQFRAGLHFDRGEFAESRTLLAAAARAGDRSAEWWLRSAWLDLHDGNVEEARAAVAEGETVLAETRAPEPWLVVGLARARAYVHVAAGEAGDASAVLQRLLARDPDDAEALELKRRLVAPPPSARQGDGHARTA